jgi:hypothetical protein
VGADQQILPHKKLIIAIAVALAAAVILAATLPGYLAYADKPAKADAVVLFLGDDSKARYMEAERLLSDGYANYLIIPILGQVFSTSDEKPSQKNIKPHWQISPLL